MKTNKIVHKIVAIAMIALYSSNLVAGTITVLPHCGYGTKHTSQVSSTCGCVYGNLCQPSNGWIQIDAHDQCGDFGTGNANTCQNQVNPGVEGNYISSCGNTFNWSAFCAAYGLTGITGSLSLATIKSIST
jgi:hypothetical protein